MKRRSIVLTVLVGVALVLSCTQGIAQRTAEATANIVKPFPRVVKCAVAGPRAALVFEPLPILPVEPVPEEQALDGEVVPDPHPVGRSIGDTYNFIRPDQAVTLRWGQMLDVKLHDEIEGVWYKHAKGWLGTVIILDIRRPDVDPENELSAEDRAWVTLGRDGAAAFRVGPSIGRAREIGVRFYPRRPGHYLLRARVYTYALPFRPTADGTAPPPPSADEIREYGNVAADVVYVKVRVVYPWAEVEELPEPVPQGEIMPHEDLSGVIY